MRDPPARVPAWYHALPVLPAPVPGSAGAMPCSSAHPCLVLLTDEDTRSRLDDGVWAERYQVHHHGQVRDRASPDPEPVRDRACPRRALQSLAGAAFKAQPLLGSQHLARPRRVSNDGLSHAQAREQGLLLSSNCNDWTRGDFDLYERVAKDAEHALESAPWPIRIPRTDRTVQATVLVHGAQPRNVSGL